MQHTTASPKTDVKHPHEKTSCGSLSPAIIRQFFEHVSKESPHAVLLGGHPEPSPLNKWIIIGVKPKKVLQLKNNILNISKIDSDNTSKPHSIPIATVDELFNKLRRALKDSVNFSADSSPPFSPFQGGMMTYFGYEFYQWCDPALKTTTAKKPASHQFQTDALFIEFHDYLIIDLDSAQLTVLGATPERSTVYQTCLHSCLTSQQQKPSSLNTLSKDELLLKFKASNPSFSEADFINTVDNIKQHIIDGNLYQANLSIALSKELSLNPFDLFETLITHNPSPFSGVLKTPEGFLLSNSPERLVSCTHDRHLETRPIAGTRGRGKTPEEDAAIGNTLLTDIKEQAEHLMLVDLERNDLGRVSKPASVEVNELLTLERYRHVTHLVSNITGTLDETKDAFDIIQATFPGGTITGCPKIRCIQTLNQLEPVPRKFYTGSLGYIGADGISMDLNILIRSVYLQKTTEGSDSLSNKPELEYNGRYKATSHFGAGIVYDSVGEHEYKECIRKAASMIGALTACERD